MQRTVHDEKRDISGNPHRGENIGQNNILRHPPLYWVTQKPINLTEVSDQQRASIPPPSFSLSLSLSQPQCGWSTGPISGWNAVSILINPDVDINKIKAGLDWKRGRLKGEGPDLRMVTLKWDTFAPPLTGE